MSLVRSLSEKANPPFCNQKSKAMLPPPYSWVYLNALLGSVLVTIGMWFLLGGFSLAWGGVVLLGLTGFFVWWSPTIAHVWAVSTLLLGLESLAWPILQMVDLRQLGPEPPLEDLQRIFNAVLFGLFSGVFWLTFSYGVYKRTQPKVETTITSAGGMRHRKKKKKSLKGKP